jgi:hypothetical protein
VVGNFAGFLYRRSDEEGIQPAAPPKPSVEWTAPPALGANIAESRVKGTG